MITKIEDIKFEKNFYKPIGGDNRVYKPKVLRWLCKVFDHRDFPHSFKDQWINWNVWNGKITVSFDMRQKEHLDLLAKIPPQLLGIPQYKTLKIVNKNTFYLPIKTLLAVDYPTILAHKLIAKDTHKDGEGGFFCTYDWQVFLADNSSIYYHNQNDKMDMKYRGFTYDSRIQERAFIRFLDENPEFNIKKK